MSRTPKDTRAWQRMLSGRRLDLLNPSPVDIEIEDIAHGLSRVARWNGQTTGEWAFSVAQHSVMVEALAVELEPQLSVTHRLQALLHDASEYVVGDMISPFKTAIGLDYREMEDRLQQAIHIRFGLPPTLPAKIKSLIKKADLHAARIEATGIAGFSEQEARKLWGKPPAVKITGRFDPTPIPPDQAKAMMLSRFNSLIPALPPVR
ncbi:hydrolase [Hwanghaeella sp. LZ110]|jgi:5'-nucleotidase|uniref:hydrolase n=1 Tax=Hwanghaeella sp. LZ110 TaxID=3402810 RepID=UPI003B680265